MDFKHPFSNESHIVTYSKTVSMRGICNRSLRMYSFNLQAPVGRRVDNAIHSIKIYPLYMQQVLLAFIRWIAIYPSDSVILPSNNWARSIIITQIYKQKPLNNLHLNNLCKTTGFSVLF